jgi:hypothetical protein
MESLAREYNKFFEKIETLCYKKFKAYHLLSHRGSLDNTDVTIQLLAMTNSYVEVNVKYNDNVTFEPHTIYIPLKFLTLSGAEIESLIEKFKQAKEYDKYIEEILKI